MNFKWTKYENRFASPHLIYSSDDLRSITKPPKLFFFPNFFPPPTRGRFASFPTYVAGFAIVRDSLRVQTGVTKRTEFCNAEKWVRRKKMAYQIDRNGSLNLERPVLWYVWSLVWPNAHPKRFFLLFCFRIWVMYGSRNRSSSPNENNVDPGNVRTRSTHKTNATVSFVYVNSTGNDRLLISWLLHFFFLRHHWIGLVKETVS